MMQEAVEQITLAEQTRRITSEVMDSRKMKPEEEASARRYVTRAMNKVISYCNRDDLPETLEDTVAQIAEDMLREELIVGSEKEIASVTRGDTSISYKNDTSRKATTDFMRNYETTLNRYRKMKLPKTESNL